MRSMTAAVFEAVGHPLKLEELVIRDPRPGEVLVKVAHCGVCHSDLSVFNGTFPQPVPIVVGHEAAGVVEAVGDGVRSVAAGDKVVLMPAPSCGRCYFCVRNQPTLCSEYLPSMYMSTMPDGSTTLQRGDEVVYRGLGTAAFAEYALMPERGIVKVAPDVDLSVACVIGCGVQTGVGAVLNTARVEEGATVAVFGAGGIGISIAQGAVIAGASTIVVIEPDADRRKGALGFGATDVLDPASDDIAGALGALTDGIGIDYVFDAVGQAKIVEQSIALARPGGTIVCVGAPSLDQNLAINAYVGFAASEKRLLGCLLGTSNAAHDIPRLIALWQAGRLNLDAMVTARFPFAEITKAVDTATALRGLRTVVDIA
jgi:Zn-dependent alcohol dehydrogenase